MCQTGNKSPALLSTKNRIFPLCLILSFANFLADPIRSVLQTGLPLTSEPPPCVGHHPDSILGRFSLEEPMVQAILCLRDFFLFSLLWNNSFS